MRWNMSKMPDLHLENSEIIFYKGQSMWPTFRFTDILGIIPYNNEKLRCGDVIVFNSPKKGGKIVHRVVSFSAGKIMTAGDNNDKTDDWFIRPCDILSKVVYVKRGNSIRRIYGGRRGLVYLAFIKAKRVVKRGVFFLLRPAYYWFSKTGIFRQMLPYRKEIRFFLFNRPEGGKEVQMIIKDQMIAKKDLGSGKVYVRRPFHLFVNDDDQAPCIKPHNKQKNMLTLGQ